MIGIIARLFLISSPVTCMSLLLPLRRSFSLSRYGHVSVIHTDFNNRLMSIGSKRRYSWTKLQCTSNDAMDIETLDKEMSALFAACRKPILSMNVTSIGEFTRDEECITKVVYGVGEDSIEAYVLPKSVRKWPLFYDTKQDEAHSCEVFCIHTDRMNNMRRKMIIENTLLGRKSITMGSTGIGKSSESNFMLLEFLRNIDRDAYPRNVLYRIPGKCVFDFSIDAMNKLVAKKIPNSRTLDEVFRITEQYNKKSSVIMLELSESDIDPKSDIPCIVTASFTNMDNTFKTLIKSGANQFMIEPPMPRQLVEQVKAIKLLSEDCGEFAPLSIEQCIETVEDRIAFVGPLARYVLSGDQFLLRKVKIDDNASAFYDLTKDLRLENISEKAQYYVAPFFKDEAPSPMFAVTTMPDSSDIYNVDILSAYCANCIVAKAGRRKDR